MTLTLNALGKRYKTIGLSPSVEIVERRMQCAGKIDEVLDDLNIVSIVHLALGLNISSESIDWLLEIIKSNDPTFDEKPDSPELKIIAEAILWDLIDTKNDYQIVTTLLIVVGAFGGVRKVNQELFDRANSELLKQQLSSHKDVIPKVTALKKVNIDKDIEELSGYTAHNQLIQSIPLIIKLFNNINASIEKSGIHLSTQINTFLQSYQKLQEETQLHWWVVNGWSYDCHQAFSSMDIKEVSIRIAKELYDLTTLELGPYAAPALFDLILQERKKETITISDIASAGSIGWRKEWCPEIITDPISAITPICLAIACSIENSDHTDWSAKFERATKISATQTLTAHDMAVQIFRELLLINIMDDE